MKKVLWLAALTLLVSVGTWGSNSAPKYTLGKMSAAQALADQATFSRLAIVNTANTTVVEAGWSTADLGGLVHARNFNGATVVAIGSDSFGEGVVTVQDINQNPRATMWVNGSGTGEVTVFNTGSRATYSMKGDQGFVSWGGDIAEHFTASTAELAPGTVVVLDPETPGSVAPSTRPYDRLVAGVVSGANDYLPGMTLGVKGGSQQVPVTLTGTVYVLATRANGDVEVGDLLVTSSVPGHAMKATDFQATQGAVLGKAMERLEGETGLIKVLVSLQ